MTDQVCTDLAVVFPGQGSQSVGMLAALASVYPVVNATFTEASDVLGYDLWARIQDGPAELLNQTTCTQPAMLAAGVAVWRCWREKSGQKPSVMAGHSLGEYTALVCADALAFPDAVRLVEKRGELMQNAVPEGSGAMAAILGLADEKVISLCDQAAQGDVVSAVNFNSPGQVVIAGNAAAVERAIGLAKEAGAKRALPLPVSVPSHCALMRTAAVTFLRELESIEIQAPNIPVIHNLDVSSHADAGEICDALAGQLYNPVRWVETIRAMKRQGINTVLELGPGKVLAGLNRRIEKLQTAIAVQTPEDIDKALTACPV